MLTTFETNQPWVVYTYITHDRFWPFWNSTRILGKSKIRCECAVCGNSEILRMPIPRFGPVPAPASGKHPERERYLREHSHPDRPHPMAWSKPLLNLAALAAHGEGVDLDLLGMRLEDES